MIYSCGHEGVVDIVGPIKDRERKLEYKRSQMCPECYKEYMRKVDSENPLVCYIECDPNVTPYGEAMLTLTFMGNTLENKDKIKALNFRWASNSWRKYITQIQAIDEIERIKTTFPEVKFQAEKNYMIHFGYVMKQTKKIQKQLREMQSAIHEIPKPSKPQLIEGKKWNHTVYGKKGRFTVYLDGTCTSITDEQAAELETYKEEFHNYKKAIEMEKQKYAE